MWKYSWLCVNVWRWILGLVPTVKLHNVYLQCTNKYLHYCFWVDSPGDIGFTLKCIKNNFFTSATTFSTGRLLTKITLSLFVDQTFFLSELLEEVIFFILKSEKFAICYKRYFHEIDFECLLVKLQSWISKN